jgi:hypothetical protein
MSSRVQIFLVRPDPPFTLHARTSNISTIPPCKMRNVCAASSVGANLLRFDFLKCAALDRGAESLLALPAPVQSVAENANFVAIVDALEPSPIVAGLGAAQLLLDSLVVCFFALLFAAAYFRVRDWVQKSSPRLSNMSIIKKSDSCFHILFYSTIWVLGVFCIWNDMNNMYGISQLHMHAIAIRTNLSN